ncbi:MAG: GNAT family N-acetyltransferase [Candidatus Eremiobacteraeota bacterium]|nr:GNAT family N-acetyltransferase [Candidatus Eremiobacteraeota bacterium]
MEVIGLTSEHAGRIHELEAQVYPPELTAGEEVIRKNLESAVEGNENLSWGVFDGDTLVGYLIAWVTGSLVEGREKEDVVLVEDIAVLPGYQSVFFTLLEALAEDARSRGGELAIEGTSREDVFRIYTRHEGTFKDLGYFIAGSHEYWDEEIQETMVWVRFEPLEREPGDQDSDEPSEEEESPGEEETSVEGRDEPPGQTA